MRRVLIISALTLLILVVAFNSLPLETQDKNTATTPPKQIVDFCGWSTYGECKTDSDCIKGGCSGEVCQSKKDEVAVSICIWKECFDAEKYGLNCRCVEGKCQWT
jgi:eight-cysteine-cluster-containing protein